MRGLTLLTPRSCAPDFLQRTAPPAETPPFGAPRPRRPGNPAHPGGRSSWMVDMPLAGNRHDSGDLVTFRSGGRQACASGATGTKPGSRSQSHAGGPGPPHPSHALAESDSDRRHHCTRRKDTAAARVPKTPVSRPWHALGLRLPPPGPACQCAHGRLRRGGRGLALAPVVQAHRPLSLVDDAPQRHNWGTPPGQRGPAARPRPRASESSSLVLDGGTPRAGASAQRCGPGAVAGWLQKHTHRDRGVGRGSAPGNLNDE